jgi:integrase
VGGAASLNKGAKEMAETRRPHKRGAGEGTVVHRSDGRWAAAVTLPSGKRKWLYGKTRADVSRKLTEAVHATQQGRQLDSNQTFGAFLHWYLKEHAESRLRPRTFKTQKMYVDKHIVPALGKIPLAKLTPQHVQAFLNEEREKGLAGWTLRQIRSIMRAALHVGARYGLVSRNVVQYTDAPTLTAAEITPLSPEQARAFLAGIAGDRLEALYVVAMATGLRQGELLGLAWEDIDLDAGQLTVSRQLQRFDGEYRMVDLKTAKSRRSIALPQVAVQSLRAHRARQAEQRLAAGPHWEGRGLVFARPDGHPLNGTVATKMFQKTIARLGLPRQRFHDLRHTAASLLLAQGVSLKEVSETLGHSQIGITANLYGHMFPEIRRHVADRMDEILGQGQA